MNLIGRNHHDLGQYAEAERCFKRSIHRLPGRMYPHYLLCLLYADPNVSDTVRFNAACAETFNGFPLLGSCSGRFSGGIAFGSFFRYVSMFKIDEICD